MKRRTTVKDVAALANVSATTVSYVLNNTPNQTITEETKARVLEAAKKLNYVRNNAAKILKNSESKCIGVVIGKSLIVERFSTTVQGIRTHLNSFGYNILLCSPDRIAGQYADYIESYFTHYLDGLIYLGRDNIGPAPKELEIIKNYNIPTVIFDCKIKEKEFAAVDFDYYGGAYDLTMAIIKKNCKRVLYFRPVAENPQETERESGFVAAMRQYPKTEIIICRFPITHEKLSQLDQAIENSANNPQKEIEDFIAFSFAPLIADFDEKDLIISSWGIYIERIEQLIETKKRRPTISSMAETSSLRKIRKNFVYCRMNHYRAGTQCAQLLLEILKEKDKGPLRVRHVTIPIEIVT